MINRLATISFHATAVLYTGGTLAQLLKLLFNFAWTGMPFVIDWLIVILGTTGAAGLICFHHVIAYRGRWDKVVHWIIVSHLLVSVALHGWTIVQGDHVFYGKIPHGYSYFALVYFAFFAWRSWTVRLNHEETSNVA